MLPDIRHILYTTDLSPNAAYAFRYALKLAKEHGAKITIMHVMPRIDPTLAVPIAAYMGEKEFYQLWKERKEEVLGRIRARLEKFTQKELTETPEVIKAVTDIRVVEGDPAAEILQEADRGDYDLVVMGSHSKGLIPHAFLGDVVTKVLRRINKPVLVVPIPRGKLNLTFEEI